jgi:hypothetical protein
VKQRFLCVSDLQVPYHSEAAVKSLMALVKREKFDRVLVVGDELDFQSQSKYAKGTHLEYEGQLDADRKTCQNILWELGGAWGIPMDITRSNHTDRLYHTLLRGAPSLIGLPELDYAKFMEFDSMGIRFHKKPFEFLKDWVLVHGDEGSLNQNPGGTAIGLAKKFGKSVLCGHTHRLGLQAYSEGIRGDYRTIWGFEVGNLMDKRKASYLKAGAANWQMGFGIIEVNQKNVTAIPVPVNKDGSFTIYGKRYGS